MLLEFMQFDLWKIREKPVQKLSPLKYVSMENTWGKIQYSRLRI